MNTEQSYAQGEDSTILSGQAANNLNKLAATSDERLTVSPPSTEGSQRFNPHLLASLAELARQETDKSVAWDRENNVVRSGIDGALFVSIGRVHDYILEMLEPARKELETMILNEAGQWVLGTVYLDDVSYYQQDFIVKPTDPENQVEVTLLGFNYPIIKEVYINMTYKAFRNKTR